MFANLVLIPYVFSRPTDQQRELIGRLILGPEPVMVGAAVVASATGIARGVIVGPIRSIEALGTPYRIVWLAAVVTAIAVFVVGGRVTSPAAHELLNNPALWSSTLAGGTSRELRLTVHRLRIGFAIELGGIVTILALMAVLRYA